MRFASLKFARGSFVCSSADQKVTASNVESAHSDCVSVPANTWPLPTARSAALAAASPVSTPNRSHLVGLSARRKNPDPQPTSKVLPPARPQRERNLVFSDCDDSIHFCEGPAP